MTTESTGAGEIFGPTVGAVSLRIARGLPGAREWVVRPLLGWANQDAQGGQDNRFLGLSTEYRGMLTAEGEPGAMAAWAGGGYLYSAFGQVLSAHAGTSAGWRLWAFMPYLGMDAFTSLPYKTRAIRGEDESGETMEKHLTFTLGGRATLGLRIEFPGGVALTGSMGVGGLTSRTDKITFIQAAGSAEWSW